MTGPGRLVSFLGAVAVVVAAFLPWVTIEGAPLGLHLLGGVEVSAAHRTVSGTDTRAWPFLLGGAVVAGFGALFGILRRLLLLLGLVTLAAGAALTYYVLHVIDIATRRDSLEHAVAHLSSASSAGPGPFVLLGAGVCILLGALAPRRRLDAVRPGSTAFDGAPQSTSTVPRAQQEPEAG